jgi:transcriptional regulator of acetoin/glycerol metabolism
MSAAGSASQGTKRKNFNVLEREEVIRHLLANSEDGVLRHGAYQEAAEKYGCSWKTIKGVWAKHEQREAAGDPSAYIGNNRKGNSGRKGIDLEDLRTRLRDIPLNERTTQRRLAAALGIPQPTLFRNLEKLGLKAHSSALCTE